MGVSVHEAALSRTYYEKRILVPVPKTGLYPKKLVYKFGPAALAPAAQPDSDPDIE